MRGRHLGEVNCFYNNEHWIFMGALSVQKQTLKCCLHGGALSYFTQDAALLWAPINIHLLWYVLFLPPPWHDYHHQSWQNTKFPFRLSLCLCFSALHLSQVTKAHFWFFPLKLSRTRTHFPRTHPIVQEFVPFFITVLRDIFYCPGNSVAAPPC